MQSAAFRTVTDILWFDLRLYWVMLFFAAKSLLTYPVIIIEKTGKFSQPVSSQPWTRNGNGSH